MPHVIGLLVIHRGEPTAASFKLGTGAPSLEIIDRQPRSTPSTRGMFDRRVPDASWGTGFYGPWFVEIEFQNCG
jgi:hypothetical protein